MYYFRLAFSVRGLHNCDNHFMKSDSATSATQEFWNDPGQFVEIRSIQVSLFGFL